MNGRYSVINYTAAHAILQRRRYEWDTPLCLSISSDAGTHLSDTVAAKRMSLSTIQRAFVPRGLGVEQTTLRFYCVTSIDIQLTQLESG